MPRAMADDGSGRRERFFDRLRQENARGPGQGVARVARLVRGGAGLANRVLLGGPRGEEVELGARELRRLEALVTELGTLKGLPMKFGQILSYLELDLPEEARGLLALLQTQSPATPFERVARVIEEDLGARGAELVARLPREPASIASIGQVYRAELADGTLVAVKVRHPDIEAAIRSDLRAAALGSGFAGAILPGMGGTARDFVAEMRDRLLEECDYALEAERQAHFGELYAGHSVLLVPAVLPDWCGPRVLTTRWIDGESFDSFCQRADPAARDRAGAALFELYLGGLYRHGIFHADPHPGNYQFCDHGRIAVFDYGCVRRFEPREVRAFAALAGAVRDDDRARTIAALRELGAAPTSNDAAYAHLRQLLRSFFGPLLRSGAHPIEGRIVVDIKQVTKDKLAIARLRLPGRLLFLFRIRFGLYAVLSRLGAVCDWSSLERGFAAGAAGPA